MSDDSLLALIKQHMEEDTRRFDAVTSKLDEIGVDVKSLMESRSYVRGAWKAILVISTIVSTCIGFVLAVLKVGR